MHREVRAEANKRLSRAARRESLKEWLLRNFHAGLHILPVHARACACARDEPDFDRFTRGCCLTMIGPEGYYWIRLLRPSVSTLGRAVGARVWMLGLGLGGCGLRFL